MWVTHRRSEGWIYILTFESDPTIFVSVFTSNFYFNNYRAVAWNLKACTHPDPRHRLNSLFVLSQRAHVRLFLEQWRIVVDIQHIDANPPSGFLPAAVSRQHGQREAAHQLIVQAGPQNDPASLLIQWEPERKKAAELESPDSQRYYLIPVVTGSLILLMNSDRFLLLKMKIICLSLIFIWLTASSVFFAVFCTNEVRFLDIASQNLVSHDEWMTG